jgi:CRISPR-associated protein Cmr2
MKYTALTIGPIFKTFSEAKRTRSIWAASYFFSWFIRNVLEKALDQNMNVILPDVSLMVKENTHYKGVKGKHGSGLYADRLYFINNEKTNKIILESIVSEVIKEVVHLSEHNIDENFLRDYLNVHILEKEISDAEQEKTNPLFTLNNLLDNHELFSNYNFDFEKNELQTYLSNKTNANTNFLAKDAFGEINKRQFRSISEIATTSLSRNLLTQKQYHKINIEALKNEDTELIDELLKLNEIEIRPYHKYYAVIYADGDNIGKMLVDINKNKLDMKLFSKSLFEFGIKAEQVIHEYGGNGIYLGGEDILTFAPLACISEKGDNLRNNLFSLIRQLDVSFAETVQEFAREYKLSIPTLSYGVMLSYYKFPLKEAMQQAHDLMTYVAKSNDKNAIAIRFQKHSGQFFECKIEKNKTDSLNLIYELISNFTQKEKQREDSQDEILSSIIQNFKEETFKILYFEAIKNKNLEFFYKNFFNEDIHKTSIKANFLMEVKELSENVFAEYGDPKQSFDIIYTVLRYIHFINSTKEN